MISDKFKASHKIKDKYGLIAAQVVANRERYGTNVLTPPRRTPLWRQFLTKFDDPLIRILLIALLLSAGLAVYEYFKLKMSAEVLIEPVGICGSECQQEV